MPATQQTIDKFRETILNATTPEHREEILELKFGCKVKQYIYKLKRQGDAEIKRECDYLIQGINYSFNGEKYYTDGYFYIDSNNQYPTLEDRRLMKIPLENETESSHFEIIGRDLTLDDILIALRNSKNIKFSDVIFGTIQATIKFPEVNTTIYWDLTKPHHLQSEETLQSIIKILE